MTISQQLDRLAALVDGNAWGAARGTPRIYLKARRDVKLYVSFEDAACGGPNDQRSATVGLFGPKLHCFVDDCGQTPAWYASQRRKFLEHGAPALCAVCWSLAGGTDDETREIIENDITFGEDVASAVANGRLDDARLLLGFATIQA